MRLRVYKLTWCNVLTNLSIGGLSSIFQVLLVQNGDPARHLWAFLIMCGVVSYLFLKASVGGPGFAEQQWAERFRKLRSDQGFEEVPILHAPGADLPEGSSYCYKCNFFRPARAHHCSECARCVLRFDHHCYALGTCVGLGNHASFVGFCLSLLGCQMAALSILSRALSKQLPLELCMLAMPPSVVADGASAGAAVGDSGWCPYLASKGTYLAIAVTVVAGVLVAGLAAYHVWILSEGMTTLEYNKFLDMSMPSRSGSGSVPLPPSAEEMMIVPGESARDKRLRYKPCPRCGRSRMVCTCVLEQPLHTQRTSRESGPGCCLLLGSVSGIARSCRGLVQCFAWRLENILSVLRPIELYTSSGGCYWTATTLDPEMSLRLALSTANAAPSFGEGWERPGLQSQLQLCLDLDWGGCVPRRREEDGEEDGDGEKV